MAEHLQQKRLGSLFLALCLTGCGLLSSPPLGMLTLAVDYLPGLVKGRKPVFPPARILVLLPVDERHNLAVRGGTLPIAGNGGEIVGIHGLNSKEGEVRVASRNLIEKWHMVPGLGVLRRMDSGMPHPPDIPKTIYTLPGLPGIVQGAIATHFREAGFQVETVSFSLPTPLVGEEKPDASASSAYALGCTIEEFSLLSLVRYQQEVVPSFPLPHIISVPVRGPTQAVVSLALSLYRWPSGEVLWQGKVENIVDDPVLGDSLHLYATPEETLTAALSRAVGSILITESLQDALLHYRS